MGLSINREKTKVVNLHLAESLDFLGFTFRNDRDLYGSDKTYLNDALQEVVEEGS